MTIIIRGKAAGKTGAGKVATTGAAGRLPGRYCSRISGKVRAVTVVIPAGKDNRYIPAGQR